jgi:hypothetical protein
MGLSCMTGQLYASEIVRIMKEAEFGGEPDPQFSGKGWTDMTEFGTVGKAMYDFPIMVSSFRGTISHGLGTISRQSQIFAPSRGGGPL